MPCCRRRCSGLRPHEEQRRSVRRRDGGDQWRPRPHHAGRETGACLELLLDYVGDALDEVGGALDDRLLHARRVGNRRVIHAQPLHRRIQLVEELLPSVQTSETNQADTSATHGSAAQHIQCSLNAQVWLGKYEKRKC